MHSTLVCYHLVEEALFNTEDIIKMRLTTVNYLYLKWGVLLTNTAPKFFGLSPPASAP